MKHRILVLLSAFTIIISLTFTIQAQNKLNTNPTQYLLYIPISNQTQLQHFNTTNLIAYAHLQGLEETYLLAGANLSTHSPNLSTALATLKTVGLSATVLDTNIDTNINQATYYLVYPSPNRPPPKWTNYGHPLFNDGIQLLLRTTPQQAQQLAQIGVGLQLLTLTPKPLQASSPPIYPPTLLEPDPTIQEMINQIDNATVYSYTGNLSGEWPVDIGGTPYTIVTRHSTSGEPIEKATEFVGQHLQNLGLDVEYHTWNASRPPNVIGQLTGSVNPDKIFILSSHLDDMPSGGIAPGADDNASGSVGNLIIADIFTQYQWGCTLRFAFWTGEEQGLLGSAAYAQRSFSQNENIVGVLNLDMIGWNTPNSSPDIDIHANSSLPQTLELAQLFADVINTYNLNLIPQIKPNGTGASDHASFWNYGYTAILGIEDMEDFNPRYHTVNDQLQYLDIPYFANLVKASAGTFAHLSNCLGENGYLNGHVTAADSGLPITNATITISDGQNDPIQLTTDNAGYYTKTLYTGAYTITASAYSYFSNIVTNVLIITDTVTTQDFILNPLPTYLITGTVTGIQPGGGEDPLLAQVQFLDPPLTVSTQADTGAYQASLLQGTYTMSVTSIGYFPQTRSIILNHNQTQNFALEKMPCILLVDDDNNIPNVRPYFTAALDNLGYTYNIFNISSGSNGPTLDTLINYDIVIWFSGDKFDNSAGPTATDENNLAAYLDSGGKLFLSSQDYLYDRGLLSTFAKTYLGVLSFENDLGNATTKYGVTGNPISQGLGPYPLSYPSGFSDYSDIINPGNGASVAFKSEASNGNNLDINKDGGNWKTVFWATSWVPVYYNNPTNGEEVLQKIINWFGGCNCEPLQDLSINWTPPTPTVNQAITFTAIATATEAITIEWAFENTILNGATVVYSYPTAGNYPISTTATNICSQQTITDTITILPPPCTPIENITLAVTNTNPIYTNTVAYLKANILPLEANTPYYYRFTIDSVPTAVMTTPNTTINLTNTFNTTGIHTINLAVWNCEMTEAEAITATTQLTVYPPAEMCLPLTDIIIDGDSNGTPNSYTFTTTYQPITVTMPITYMWDNGDSTANSIRTWLTPTQHTLAITATNQCSLVTNTHTITITDNISTCTALTHVALTAINSGSLYIDSPTNFQADFSPLGATAPYTYHLTIDGSVGQVNTTNDTPLVFSTTFSTAGLHTVTISTWNCEMLETEAVMDTITIQLIDSGIKVYLPLIIK